MATRYSSLYSAIPQTATSSGALSTSSTYEFNGTVLERTGQIVELKWSVSSSTPTSGDVYYICNVRKGTRVDAFSITNGDFDSATTITHKIGFLSQGSADQLGSGLTYFRGAASSTVTTQAVLDAADGATDDRVLAITITASGDQAATMSGVLRLYMP